jgi:class 3 adenylate cyclase/tetratricopeptide (TPR) repeat protein
MDNREGRKFCAQCGTPLRATCPACGTTNEPGERFCGECGSALAAPASSSPEAVPASGERKHITVLFADVAGSMDLQEDLDPEAWASIMGRFVAILAEGVRKYGGTVDKFTGDGIMALFGAPVAQEDHARRACHAAWHLTKAIAGYAAKLQESQAVDLHVRLGLNSGEVVVGRVGDDVTLDPTALGHTVGLAQRMEAQAEPGKAYLTERTARLVEGWFQLEDLGPTLVKGARGPLRVYALEGPSPSPPILHGGSALGPTPLAGRDGELAILENALAMAMEGHAQVVGVVGEAGVGKSRLCEEFARAAADRGITVRRAAGVSHGKGVPLLPILAYLRDYFGVTATDSAEQAREKIAGRLLDLDPALDETLPLVFDFLEVPDPDHPAPRLGPEVRMRRVFETIRRVTQRRSEREVLLLLFEDLHWFDPQSETFLGRLIESFSGSRTLVVTNFRPEFSAPWMGHSSYRGLSLAPLRDAAVGELLGGLLGVDLSLAPLVGFVLERTSGNPFFVEEVIRALVEDGTLAGGPGDYRLTRPLHELKVPPSVQAVLAARIDRLPADHKAVLQTAAVIGRSFAEPVLAHVIGEQKLGEALRALCASELLQEAGGVGEYRFWHPLTQEVAYGSLLAERRQGLHAAVAEALIDHQPERLDEQAAVICWHWERAAQHLEAARWSLRAGNWAIRTDLAEAVRRWQAVTEFLDPVEETPESLQLGIQARMRLLRYGARRGMAVGEVQQFEAEGRVLAERLGDPRLAAMMALSSGTARQLAGELTAGRTLYREAVCLADETDVPDLKAGIRSAAAGAFPFSGPLGEGLALTSEVLELCGDDPDRGSALMGYGPLGLALALRGHLLCRMGRLAEAVANVERAIANARSRSEPEALATALVAIPWLRWLSGEPEDTVAVATEVLRLGEETGNKMVIVFGLEAMAIGQMTASRPDEVIAACARALTEGRATRAGLQIEGELLALLARARFGTGDLSGAADAAGEAVQVAHRQGAQVVECFALLTRAQVQREAGGDSNAVLADLDAARALVRETGALTYEPFLREELARLRGDEGELREALRLYGEIGATGHTRRLEAELGERASWQGA